MGNLPQKHTYSFSCVARRSNWAWRSTFPGTVESTWSREGFLRGSRSYVSVLARGLRRSPMRGLITATNLPCKNRSSVLPPWREWVVPMAVFLSNTTVAVMDDQLGILVTTD